MSRYYVIMTEIHDGLLNTC